MFLIKSVSINKIWGQNNAIFEFNEDVNIIIGKNGTGKTTFMNILTSILTVDIDSLCELDFESINIHLKDKKLTRKISANITYSDEAIAPSITYTISNKKYQIPLVHSDDRKFGILPRKRSITASAEIREALRKLVDLSSLSVYRLKNSEDIEIRERGSKRILSPVDYKLNQLCSQFTQYQLEVANQARNISNELQKDVLTSLLISENSNTKIRWPKSFNKEKERRNLVTAYKRLGVLDTNVSKKIKNHVDEVDSAFSGLSTNSGTINFSAIDAYLNTNRIVELSLEADSKINKLFSQIELFFQIINEFIPEKKFTIDNGFLEVFNEKKDSISTSKLSSGEKQLLIILIEALLQRQSKCIYITDEPELSLHIEWQRNIIPAVKRINPQAQVIAATHSPEVASKYKGSIYNIRNSLSHG
ncbi:hemin importer ATP-binding subunit [Vibrio cholerae]|uniref:AAA family ATPase n=1 Tax=Vibrio cholerae TaxID=666 RepID=UPI000F407C7A|nr:AAA family ATPase [Vibrio cholerae]RNE71502.1 ATP-binding protein [Vibrio cholerae]CAB1247537.1 hemin importer ATP-binding subunit [Vibrio cholerae]